MCVWVGVELKRDRKKKMDGLEKYFFCAFWLLNRATVLLQKMKFKAMCHVA